MNTNNNKNLAMVDIVPLRPYLDKLAESESIGVQNVCNTYREKIDNGTPDAQICEQFVIELSRVADTKESKKILKEVNESVVSNEMNLRLARSIYQLPTSSCVFVAPVIESAVVDYMTNKNDETRGALRNSLSLFEGEQVVKDILETVQYEEYEERNGKTLKNVSLKESFVEPKAKTYTEAEVEEIINKRVSEMKVETVPSKKHLSDIPHKVRLNESISNIMNGCRNEKVRVICEKYISALNNGASEETLYETFISSISPYNYLNAVDTELSAIEDRVGKYKQEIDLRKIVDTMKQTGSYFIVPLIDDLVADYVEHKSMQTRFNLINRLQAFEYDPYVRDIIMIVQRDESLPNAVNIEDPVEYVNSQVKTAPVYSPVQYVKENECVFNVKGCYFARRGNNISKLTKNEIDGLSESFKGLCKVVNSDNVKIAGDLNQISVYGNNDVIKITESDITVNGKEVTSGELKSLMERAIAMRSDDAEYYAIAVALNEHYNDIAYIDFVKRIETRDNSGRSCDVFKINENIFVNTTDKMMNRSVFYRNVNPIQCRNYINEHMEINCNSLFEDELPDQQGVVNGIEEKKAEYQTYINELEEKKETLRNMKEEGADTDDIDQAIFSIDQELEKTKADYKKYQEDSEKYLKGDKKDSTDSLKDETPGEDDEDKPEPKDQGSEPADDQNDDKKGKELDPEKESPEDMETPLGDTGEEPSDTAEPDTDDDDVFEFPEEFGDVADYDPDFDIPTEVVSDEDGSKSVGYGKFQIVKVAYNRNVKTGVSNGHGEVIILIPSVDANGDIHNDTRKVSFYLDKDRNPVINNEYMPLDMYEEIVDAIENDEMTGNVECVGCVKDETPAETDDMDKDFLDSLQGMLSDDEPDTAKDEPETEPTIEAEPQDSFRETPAETKAAETDAVNYPITVGLYPEEIKPIKMDTFKKDVEDMGIEHTESEANDGEVILKVKNLAQAKAMKDYFLKWFNQTDDDFLQYMPEIARCFRNNPDNIVAREVHEGVSIAGVHAITDYKPMHIVLPCNESLKNLFGISCDDTVESFSIITESKDEEMKVYESLYGYALKNGGNVEQDVVDVLEAYGKKYGRICESGYVYKLNVPYNNFLEQKLQSKGFDVKVVNENMTTEIVKDDFKKAKKVLESFYGDKAPVEVRDFYNHVDENVTITVKDDTTGKTVTINTDDINGGNGGNNEESQPDFSSSFDNVTFNPEDSLAFTDDEESADENPEEKKENTDNTDETTENKESEEDKKDEPEEKDSKKEDNEEEGKEGEESGDNESEDEKKKKKFKFKVSKGKTEESLDQNGGKPLNESTANGIAKPTVLDYVKCNDGNKGQIICQQMDGNFIVNVAGHTRIYSPNQVEPINQRLDLVDTPFKYDEATLAGVYESYVNCGMFVNGIQVTPNDCHVKLLEYMTATDNNEINIIIEGESAKAQKRYIRILEDLNDVLDLANYAPGVMTHIVEGVEQKVDVLVNVPDYRNYVMMNESSGSVRTLVFDENNETHMMNIPGRNLVMKGTEGLFESREEKLIDYAVSALAD